MPAKHLAQNLWLIKPANSNQGRGIEVFNSLKDIMKYLENKAVDSKWVVQKYLEKPLLWHNRKFDIRVWVLVTSKGEIFYYEQGYMRTTTQEYNDQDVNKFIHLTNVCLQQNQNDFGKFEDGNCVDYYELEEYIRNKYGLNEFNFDEHIVKRMKDLILDSILSQKEKLFTNKKN